MDLEPYGPCGRKPMSCESINLRYFRRLNEPYITKQRRKNCEKRNAHRFYPCLTIYDENGNFRKCDSKNTSSINSKGNVLSPSHKKQISDKERLMNSPTNSFFNTATNTERYTNTPQMSNTSARNVNTPQMNTSARNSQRNTPQMNTSARNVNTPQMSNTSARNVNTPQMNTSAQNSPLKSPAKKQSSKKKKEIMDKSIRESQSQEKKIGKYFLPYSSKLYTKYYVSKKDSFLQSIKNYLHYMGLESYYNIGDINSFKTLYNLSDVISEYEITKICNTYRLCIDIWDFSNNAWYKYGDLTDCNHTVLLFKEKKTYGYLLMNSAETKLRKSKRTKKD